MNEEVIEGSAKLERLLEDLLQALSPAGQKRLLMMAGRRLAALNRARISANVTPDGAPFAPRKIRERLGGRARYAHLSALFAALEAQGKKESVDRLADRLKAYHASHGRRGIRERLSSGRLRKRLSAPRKMFRKLKSIQYLNAHLIPEGVAVGFKGKAGFVARIHHYGLGKNLPARPLLGLTAADERAIEEVLWDQFAKILSG